MRTLIEFAAFAALVLVIALRIVAENNRYLYWSDKEVCPVRRESAINS